MRKLAVLIVRRRWAVIIGVLIALVIAGVLGGGVHDRLSGGGFEDPSTESALARAEIKASFPQAALSDFVLVVTAKDGTVDRRAAHAHRHGHGNSQLYVARTGAWAAC